MELFTNTLTENYNTSVKITPEYKWIDIIDYKIKQDQYGLVGWVKYRTEKYPQTQIISSIHLGKNETFKRFFKWKI